MCKQAHALARTFLAISFGTAIAGAQGRVLHDGEANYSSNSLWVTATAAEDHILFASLGLTHRMRLEVLNQAGEIVFDSRFQDGNLLDWDMNDSKGNLLPDDIYGCLITVEDVTAQLSQRRALIRVANRIVRLETSQIDGRALTASSESQETMTLLRNDEELPIVQFLHDGESARIVSGKGDLSFRIGNALAGKDVEYVRLTADGDLGIGIKEPLAKLDVAGIIRARGIMFSDGTIQRTAAGGGIVALGGLEQRLNGDRTLVVRGKTGATTTSTTSTPAAVDASRQMLTTGKAADPIYSLEGPTNTFYGLDAGSITTGNNNSFLGSAAGYSNTMGDGNSFFGYNAGYFNTTGYSNSFFGDYAGYSNTTGENNSFLGESSGYNNTTGYGNSFFGWTAGYYNTTGGYNSFVGHQAGKNNTTGGANTFVGSGAGLFNTTGNDNSMVGDQAGLFNTSGYLNSFVGSNTGRNNTSGNQNSFLGAWAGASNTAEDNNTCIGANSDGAPGITNATAVGSQAKVTQSNSLVLGSINGVNGSIADTKVGIGTTSPDRKLQIASSPGMNAELHIGGPGDETKDVYSGMGPDLATGPALNFGYSGYSFGRSSGFINIRPDVSATPPNPSLRFMTANQQRMIITNTGHVGIGTALPKTTLQANGGDIFIGSPGQGIILMSPDGLMCVRLTVSNAGALVSTPMACP
jgi:hypothetical protein